MVHHKRRSFPDALEIYCRDSLAPLSSSYPYIGALTLRILWLTSEPLSASFKVLTFT